MSNGNNFLQKQRGYFNEVASSQKDHDFFEEDNATSSEYSTIINLMDDLQHKAVLEIGCGTGRYALRIAKLAKETIGVDISDKSIEFANKKANECGVSNFKGIVFDYSKPLREDFFDFVLMVNVAHHIDNLDSILKNIYRSLKKDGQLIIFEFNPLNLLFIPFLIFIKQFKSHVNKAYFRSNIFSLRRIIRKNRYDIVSFRRYALLPTCLYNLSMGFKRVNMILNSIPILNLFSAFHILICEKQEPE